MDRKSLLNYAALVAAGMLIVPFGAHAQTAVVGSLGNFDAANNEGKDAYGFEIEIEGIHLEDLSPSWCGNKFGCPVVVPSATGVYVRYQSPYDASTGRFTAATVPHTPGTAFAGTCYTWNGAYARSGCDHFGVHVNYTAASRAITAGYRWMFEDPNSPGRLVASSSNIFVPTPVYTWVAPAQLADPPVLQVEIAEPPAPPPPPAMPPQYGDATWLKVYKTEMAREVRLEELTGDNAIVPQEAAQVESEWTLMQASPPSDGGHRQRNRQVNSGSVKAGTRAVLRRYETYAYTGAYDPLDHAAVCGGDATCSAPQPGELGDMRVAQMIAANVANPSLAVTVVGNGDVSSTDRVISCGGKCSGTYALDMRVDLAARAGSNSTFTGWTGACTGTSATCTVTIADAMAVTATFAASPSGGGGGGAGGSGGGGGGGTTFKLGVAKSKTGTVTATPAGVDAALDCGVTCTASFARATAVTLTATPAAGKSFLGWSGGCTGTAPMCTVTMNADVSVQPQFSR